MVAVWGKDCKFGGMPLPIKNAWNIYWTPSVYDIPSRICISVSSEQNRLFLTTGVSASRHHCIITRTSHLRQRRQSLDIECMRFHATYCSSLISRREDDTTCRCVITAFRRCRRCPGRSFVTTVSRSLQLCSSAFLAASQRNARVIAVMQLHTGDITLHTRRGSRILQGRVSNPSERVTAPPQLF